MFLALVFWLATAVLLFIREANAFSEQVEPDYNQQSLFAEYDVFKEGYDDYKVSEEELEFVAGLPDNVEIKVFFGTWCHDSKREVPRLLKSFQSKSDIIKLYSLDHQKSHESGLEKTYKVKYTPTIVVLVDGQEVGRIVEHPEATIAEDISVFVGNANSAESAE